MISIIIPCLNEEEKILKLLENLHELQGDKEILFIDGGSMDNTLTLLSDERVIRSDRGRGLQLNTGARHARGETLLFLHADSRVERDLLIKINKEVEKGAVYGCLSIHFDKKSFLMLTNAFFSTLRARLGRTPFGDQGIFISRDLFFKMGCFPEIPIMEDYSFTRRLKRRRVPLTFIKSPILSSARRYKGKTLKTMATMFYLRHLYRRGVSPEIIKDYYQDIR